MNNVEGLTRYTESASISPKLLKKVDTIELRESLSRCPRRLTESLESEATEGWWVPISFYNKKNGNGRVYNRQLWENVINNQKDTWFGAPMLADHPEGDSDGSPKDICGVWIDAKLGEPEANGNGLVYGLLVPSGHIGEDLKDHLSKGLRIGTSSSGFGKLMSDGCTVDPNTYQIERLSDWVLNPSQGTFFSWDESNEIQDRSIRESQENITTNNIKEKVVKDSKITKLEEKKFRRDMESFLEDASKIKDPQERLEEFKEIRSYLEEGVCPDLKEKVEAKIAEQEAFIKQALQEKVELKEELDIDGTNDLKQKLTKISEDVNILKTEAHDWKKISEKLQSRYLKAKKELTDRPTEAYVEYQRAKINSLTEKLSERTNTSINLLSEMKEAYEKALEEKKELQEKIDALNYEKICEACACEGDAEEMKEFLDGNSLVNLSPNLNVKTDDVSVGVGGVASNGGASGLLESLKDTEKPAEEPNTKEAILAEEYIAKNKDLQRKLKEANDKIILLAQSLNESGNKYREAQKSLNTTSENLKESVKAHKEKEDNNLSALEEANKKIQILCTVCDRQKESMEKLSKENTVLKEANERKRKQLTEATQELKNAKATETQRPVKKAPASEVDKYFESLYRQYGNEVLPYKDAITGAITLSEAKKYFFTNVLQNLRESEAIEKIRIPENLYTTPEERIGVMNEKKFTKTSSVDRLPEGWL